jgi:hypothetical protein
MSKSFKRELPGKTEWYNEQGLLHREDGPAVEYVDGDKTWWVNGKRHRIDGQAVNKDWWVNGILLRMY